MLERANRIAGNTAHGTHMINTVMALAVACTVGFAPAWAAAQGRQRVVRYEDFGAVGDGQTDDLEALARAHAHANKHGLPVRANDNATYYIGGGNTIVAIQTDTHFGKAKFIIDDRNVVDRKQDIFIVRSTLEPIKPEGITSLKQDQARINIKLPQACMISVTDENTKRYRRKGANRHGGVAQNDIFVVDANGNVDPGTPIIWDFDNITDIIAYPIDPTPLKITGGHFTTIANNAPSKYDYFHRGLAVRRSNVIIDGIEHYVTGEGNSGAPYSCFLDIESCANVIVRNGIFTARKTYRTKLGNFRKKMGTYDIGFLMALNISFINCRQSNDINDDKYWGIMASNLSKNLLFDGCSFSRFDAHQGVANATLRNSTFGYMGIRVIGSGTLLMENTTVLNTNLVNLREDYGSTWRGVFIIRNCVLKPNNLKRDMALITGSNNGSHDHGYTCHMPERIIIENLRIEDANPPDEYDGFTVLGNFNGRYTDPSYTEKNPYIKPKEIIVKGVTTASGKPLRVSRNPVMFRDVRVQGMRKD